MGVKIANKDLFPPRLFNPAYIATIDMRSVNNNKTPAKINSYLKNCFSHFGGLVGIIFEIIIGTT